MVRTVSAAVVAMLAAVTVAVTTGAAATPAGCSGMSVVASTSSGSLIALRPRQVAVAFGGCVRFHNQTIARVTVTVGATYSQVLAPGASTTARTDYVGRTPGRQKATATAGPSTATGSVDVGARPSPSPSRSSSPAASPSPSPTPAASVGTTGPQVARSPRDAPPVVPSLSVPPPVTTSDVPVPSAVPTVAPSPGPVASAPASARTDAVAGVEQRGSRSVGLPAAVAALVVVGTGGALVRVVAAEAVDDGADVGGGG